MTDKERIKHLETLGWGMYNAAQNLTTDASSLHKAMNKWWQFVNHELQEEETVSEDLEEAARKYVTPPCALGIRTFKAGANWREKQGEQKPIKWSKDDKNKLLIIEQILNCASLLINAQELTEIKNWLNSLKQRIGG